MIEIRKTPNPEDGPAEYRLFIDGTLVEGAEIQAFGDDHISSISSSTQNATEKLLKYPLRLLLETSAYSFRLLYEVSWNEAAGQLWPSFSDPETGKSKLYLLFNRVSRWRRRYSFEEYFEELILETRTSPLPNVVVEDTRSEPDVSVMLPFDVFVVSFTDIDKELPLKDELERCLNSFRSIHDKAVTKLEAKYPSDSIEICFDFPEEVRVACEQYLLYFVQFLRDLGVNATAELRHFAGEVLFAVTPADKATALDNIRTALETYLQLPSSPIANDAMAEVAMQRLAANVEHLKGQVRLASAEIQLKEATIEAQQTTIQLLRGNVMLESLKDVTPKSGEDKEPVLLGTVALTKFNWKGLEINYPEIFRKLRALFKKNQN